MQQKALVTIFGLVLVVSVGYALSRMAGGSGAAAYGGGDPTMVTSTAGEADACASGDKGTCDMSAKDKAACDMGSSASCPMSGEEKVAPKADDAAPAEEAAPTAPAEGEAKPVTTS